MSTITAVKPNPKNDAQGFAVFDDGTEAWTPERAKIEPLIGKPLPPDWTLKDGPYGKQLLPPKEGKGGGTAFRNTKEGFLLDQQGYERSAERSDRRTALMQAVTWCHGTVVHEAIESHLILEYANDFYDWLRNTSSSPAPTDARTISPTVGTTAGGGDGTGSARTTPAPAAGDSSAVPRAADTGQAGVEGEGTPACPPHLADLTKEPTRLGRVPCARCGVFVRVEAREARPRG